MTARPEPVVEAVAVTRRFGDTLALDDVSLVVRPGELVGLLGPNGAGKTTLLSLVTGLRRPDAGTVRLFGGDPRHPASRLRLGTTPQETGLPPTLKVGEVVDFIAGHYPDPMPRGEVLERFGIGDLAGRQTGGLSGGQKRRLAVALALVGRPRLVVLDEPTTGLDVEARHILWQALRDYHADGATVLVTSHYLEEIEALAERVVVIGAGKVLADDALAAVLARVTMRRVLVDLPGASDRQVDALPGVTAVARTGDRFRLLVSDADQLVRSLVLDGVPFAGLEVRGASLEEAFLALTSAEPGGGPGGVVRGPGGPVGEPSGLVREPGGPVGGPGGPVGGPGGPVAEPVREKTEPVALVTEPVREPAGPVELVAEPVVGSAEPTVRPAEPVEPARELVEPAARTGEPAREAATEHAHATTEGARP